MSRKKILLVEDDPEINLLLTLILKEMDLSFTSAFSGTEALLLYEHESFDLVLLDLMLPGKTGHEVLQTIRKTSNIPVIVISAKTALEDKVELLRFGADDYITKPFHEHEVKARIEVQLRRNISASKSTTNFSYREFEVKNEKREITLNAIPITLTAAEYDILYMMLQRPGHVFSKAEIYRNLWTGPYLGDDNTISVHISNLRKKIKKYSTKEYIKTVWGIGFKIDEEA